MLATRHLPIVVLLLASLSTLAAETDDCAARLTSDPFTGAVRKCLTAGSMDLHDLDTLIASPKPINIFSNKTPGSRNASAKRLFEGLANDPLVAERWPAIVSHLQSLRVESVSGEIKREDASRAIEYVFAPSVFATFDNHYPELALTENDGNLLMAHVSQASKLEVSRLPDKSELFSAAVPEVKEWLLRWHRDTSGALWLYAVGARKDEKNPPAVLRLKWGTKNLEHVPTDMSTIHNKQPSYLIDLDPGTIVLSINLYDEMTCFNLASGKGVRIPGVRVYPLQGSAVSTNGKLVVSERRSHSKQRFFRRASGEVLRADADLDRRSIRIADVENSDVSATVNMVRNRGPIVAMRVLEWKTRIFVAVIQSLAGGDAHLSVIEPFATSKQEVYSEPLAQVVIGDTDMIDYVDPVGIPHIAFNSQYGLVFVDFLNKQTFSMGLSVSMERWYTGTDGNPYFWRNSKGEIYRLYDRVTRDPNSVTDDCEARLSADRVSGGIRAALTNGSLTLHDVALMANSPRPLDPLASTVRNSRNASAKSFLENLVADPKSIGAWPTIAQRLRTIVTEGEALDHAREDARAETRAIYDPEIVFEIKGSQGHYAMGEIDGEAIVTYREGRLIHVQRISDKAELGGSPFKLPAGSGELRYQWHRDEGGHPWLYLAGHHRDLNRWVPDIFRMRWGSGKIERIKFGGMQDNYSPIDFVDAGPHFFILRMDCDLGHLSINLANGEAETLGRTRLWRNQPAVEKNGTLYAQASPTAVVDAFFKTSNDKVFAAVPSTDGNSIWVMDKEMQDRNILAALPVTQRLKIAELALGEWNGELYLAVAQKDPENPTRGQLTVYRPHHSEKEIYTSPVSFNRDADLKFMVGPNNTPLLAYSTANDGYDLLNLNDFGTISGHNKFRIPRWLNIDGQIYLGVLPRASTGLEISYIYQLFKEPK